MKKWCILIPSAITVLSAPLVGMVSCKNDKDPEAHKVEVDEAKVWAGIRDTRRRAGFLFNSEPISIEANVTYTVTYDLNKYQGSHFRFDGLCFAQGLSDEKPNLLEIPIDTPINKLVVDGQEVEFDWVSCSNPFDSWHNFDEILLTSSFEITNESIIEMQITFDTDFDNFYFMAWCADWWE